jgi:biopolymer transport protein ExbD
MGVSAETGGGGGRRSVDVEVNLVPFIDLMTCLVAFLLLTATWTNLAQIDVTGRGGAAAADATDDPPERIRLAVLIAPDAHWVGLTSGERRHVPRAGDEYDWPALGALLEGYREAGVLGAGADVDVAADEGVRYEAIVGTMDVAIAHGYRDVGYVDPRSLPVRFGR